MKQSIFYGICILMFFVSCKKDSSRGSKDKKITSIVQDNANNVFSYDAQGRLQRIDYGISSYVLVEYKTTGIVLQWYDGAGNPNADKRNEYNVLDGKIVSGKQYKASNYMVDHVYQYDNERRLFLHTARQLLLPAYEETKSIQFMYSYSGDKVSKVSCLLFDHGAKLDSNVIRLSYYDDKKFYSMKNIGFDFFGTVTAGMDAQGTGISSPNIDLMPYYIASPSNNAIKEITRERYDWNALQNKWVFKNTDTQSRPDTLYRHDTDGYLIYYGGAKIEWK